MATVNEQITDSVTQANVEVVGMAPGIAMANLYQATSNALSCTANNMSVAQAMGANLMIASTGVGVAVLNKLATQVAG
jgi:hypothetical protein